MIYDNVAPPGKSLDGQKRPIVEAMLAVLGLTARRDTHAVTHGQGEWRRPVCLEPVRKLGRRLGSLAYNKPRPLGVAWGILVELDEVTELKLRRVRFLCIRQMSGNPCLDNAFLAELALRLQPGTNGLGDPIPATLAAMLLMVTVAYAIFF